MALDFFGTSADTGGEDFGGGSDSGGSGGGGLFGGGGLGGLSGFASGIGGFFGGMQDSKAFKAEAASYEQASKIATENVGLEEEATSIKQYQSGYKLSKTIGEARAAQAANGFQEGGSGLSVIGESTRQGAIEQGMIGVQGAIQENAYREQAAMAEGEAKAAEAAASKAKTGGFMSMLGGLTSLIGMF